ncbi:FAD-dependent oxidoreductase [Ornithinibacillus halotolerans]|uniref:Oxidoreductase n=1 Tax=Ornithinibacillus halotolerans TaxID=1274357 RepID=A0A916RZY0_9BACI|nr:FAD-dependent oxidoreductase [Ornithinibacillus halotolerans]GGA78611.1 oxidoreductase [Ornithinibacillus halotolerans]
MIAVFKKKELEFLGSKKESDNVYSFQFKKGQDLTWEAGQHGLFTITHKKIKSGTKPFSVASAPKEDTIRITTKINDTPSEYKKALLELKPGMTITMSGPVGAFHLKADSPTILIAGGIGITPFRSILKQLDLEGNSNQKPIHLLYMDSDKSYIFKDELNDIANSTSISVTYFDSRDRLYNEIDKYMQLYKDNEKYFIAGPKSMVDSVSAYLQENKVSKQKIKKDVLYGY